MQPTSDAITVVVIVVTVGTGAIIDALTRRIPNALVLATCAAGFGLAASGMSHVTLGQSIAGLVLGMLLMLPGYALRATGAGDVKLLGAAGAVLGVALVPAAFLYTAIAGGFLALAVALARRSFGTTIRGIPRIATAAHGYGSGRDRFFAYGPAIAVGCVLAALGV